MTGLQPITVEKKGITVRISDCEKIRTQLRLLVIQMEV